MNDARPVTLRDVAKVAGVSVSTASKAMNDTGRVSQETRARVLEVASRLNFQPNALAQFFALRRSFSVGVLAQRAGGLFAMPVITGIVSELSENDVAVLVYDDHDDPAVRYRNLRKLQARKVDAILVVGDGVDAPIASVSHLLSVPVVHAFTLTDNLSDTAFVPDDAMAGRLAAQHLVDSGRRRIAHITSDRAFRTVREREQSFREVLDEAGLGLALGSALYGTWRRAWGYEAGSMLLDHLDEIDAVFCGNDFIAQGVIRRLLGSGIRVPDDLAVIGYDNWRNFGGDEDQYLTTIDPHHVNLGRSAARHLIEAIDGVASSGVVFEPCELVPGYSTGAVQGEDSLFPMD